MSLKEDVDYVKKEISAEESYIENFFKIEKLFKKYKGAIITASALIVISTAGYYISSYLEEENKIQANEAFNTLLEDPKNLEAIAVLKAKNERLYEILKYKTDETKETNEVFFKELSLYSKAIKENNLEKINNVTQKQEFLLKDFALFNKALIQSKNEQYTDAKETLSLIDEKSEIAQISKMLEHFLLTK